MKIILTKDIKGQGKKGQIKEVKDGFGSFLIKQGDAVLASEGNVKQLNTQKKKALEQEEQLIKECEQIKQKLEQLTIQITVKTGNQDRVFGSVSSKQIVTELKNKGYNIDKNKVKINEALTSLGTHIVDIELHKQVIAKVKINLIK